MWPVLRCAAPLTVLLLASSARAELGAAYPLDALPREITSGLRPSCPDVELVKYGGSSLRYHKPTLVYAQFVPHLRELEALVRETAIEVYGRAPRTLRHAGTFNCRFVRGYATLLSEHALGNAIDVEGFDFARAPRGAAAPAGLRGAFTVRLGRDWNASRGAGALHARFLRLLAERVIERKDMFRVVLGPSYPGHKGHFHFDLAPYRLVHVFGYQPSN